MIIDKKQHRRRLPLETPQRTTISKRGLVDRKGRRKVSSFRKGLQMWTNRLIELKLVVAPMMAHVLVIVALASPIVRTT